MSGYSHESNPNHTQAHNHDSFPLHISWNPLLILQLLCLLRQLFCLRVIPVTATLSPAAHGGCDTKLDCSLSRVNEQRYSVGACRTTVGRQPQRPKGVSKQCETVSALQSRRGNGERAHHIIPGALASITTMKCLPTKARERKIPHRPAIGSADARRKA